MLKKTSLARLLFCLLGIFCVSALSQTTLTLSQKINNIINKTQKNAHYGVYITSLSKGKISYAKNVNSLFLPASVQKIITAAAALTYLKPSFRFQTKVYTTGKIKNKQLNGNLIFEFGGDPSFTDNTLNQMLHRLNSKNIKTINGDIIINTHAYNNVPYPPGYLWDDLSYDFAAPLKTIIINDNKFGINFIPAKKIGAKPILTTALPLNTIRITNNIRTIKKYEKHCPITIYSDAHNHYTINGCLLQKSGEQYRSLAIRNPLLVLKSILKKQLADNKITLLGKIKTGNTPDNATRIETHWSKPLSKLIKHLLKTSDNLYASSLVKKVGQRYYNTQGSWQNGLRAIKYILKNKMRVNTKAIRINDGAGLSRYNLLSPKSICQVLDYIYQHRTIRKVFWKSLPIAGVDGTLAGRMRMLAKGKKLRAKTGTMTSASSLAGFAYSKKQRYIFAIMINNYVGKKIPFLRLENKIAELLMRT